MWSEATRTPGPRGTDKPGLTGARPVLRAGQDSRIHVDLRMLQPQNKTLRAAEPWAQLLGLGGPGQPWESKEKTSWAKQRLGGRPSIGRGKFSPFSAAQFSKILKTRVQKTPLNQRSIRRQDRVELPPSDPGLSLQHHHPAECWPGVPISPESTPEPQISQPQHIPPGI